MTARLDPAPASLLYVPGHKARALEKARDLPADMLIIDLEDAVPAASKDAAREAARTALAQGFAGKRLAVRINGPDTAHHDADLALVARLAIDAVVLPKVENAAAIEALGLGELPVLAMIETPAAVFEARAIASHGRVAGLIAGLNDLAHALRLPDGGTRAAMGVALQTIVMSARAAGKLAFDGVCNAIDDAELFAAEAQEGHALGFDGKTLIHPSQVGPCNAAFGASAQKIAAAEALIAAASGGAERHDGRMIEDMHVAAARALLAREALRAAGRTAIAAA